MLDHSSGPQNLFSKYFKNPTFIKFESMAHMKILSAFLSSLKKVCLASTWD